MTLTNDIIQLQMDLKETKEMNKIQEPESVDGDNCDNCISTKNSSKIPMKKSKLGLTENLKLSTIDMIKAKSVEKVKPVVLPNFKMPQSEAKRKTQPLKVCQTPKDGKANKQQKQSNQVPFNKKLFQLNSPGTPLVKSKKSTQPMPFAFRTLQNKK